MNSCKAILSICMQNIRKWCKDYRIWSIAILLVIIIQIYVDDITHLLLMIIKYMCTYVLVDGSGFWARFYTYF